MITIGTNQAGQITIQWLHFEGGEHEINLETKGIRNQLVTLLAAGLNPEAIKAVHAEGGMKRLSYLLD
jgi:hypothetical protein